MNRSAVRICLAGKSSTRPRKQLTKFASQMPNLATSARARPPQYKGHVILEEEEMRAMQRGKAPARRCSIGADFSKAAPLSIQGGEFLTGFLPFSASKTTYHQWPELKTS